MKQLNTDLKTKDFKHVYLLFGDEDFLKRSYRNRLKSAIVGDDDINYAYFEGKDSDVNAVIDSAETMPFFSEHRLIVIENSGWCKSGGSEMADYLARIPESTYIIFSENEVDRRNKLFKAISSTGYAAELSHPKPEELLNWSAGILKQSGKKITRTDLEIFLTYTGNDMILIKNELDKLISYLGDRDVVTREDIENISTRTLTNKVYDMCRAITQKKTSQAMALYKDLLALKEPPISIIYKIARQFNQLLTVKDMMAEGKKQDVIAGELRIQNFIAGKLMQQVRSYDRGILMSYVERCLDMEELIKSGDMPDRLAVEILICG